VKLTFSRDVDLPNLKEIKKLEVEYFSLQLLKIPELLPHGIIDILFLPVWVFYYFFTYKPNKPKAEAKYADVINKRNQIMNELERFG
jgi:hypothetical protein